MIKSNKLNVISESESKKMHINYNFILLISGNTVSNYGNYLYAITIIWILTSISASPFQVSLINLFETLPALIFGFLIGAIIDKLNKKKIMIYSDFLSSLIILIVTVLFFFNHLSLWYIYAATFLLGVCSCFFSNSQLTLIPKIVEEEKLQKANSEMNLASQLVRVIGNSTSGIIFGLFGAAISMIINAISFIVSGVCVTFIKNCSEEKAMTDDINYKNLLSDIIEGLKYLNSKMSLKLLMIMSLTSNIGFATMILLPVYIKRRLSLGIFSYGLIEAASAIGMILGSFLLAKVEIKKPHKTLALILLLIGVNFIIISLMASIYILALCRVFMGFLLAIFNIVFITEFQKDAEEAYIGRVLTTSYIISTVLYPISSLFAGFIANYIGIEITWLFYGIFIFIISLANIIYFNKCSSF